MNSLTVNSQITSTSVEFDPFAGGEVLLTAPATESQKEVWASVQMSADANCAYNESQTLRFKGDLDVDALRLALNALVQRHEALRTTFSPDGTTLCITNSLDIEILIIELSGLDPLAQNAEVTSLRQRAVEEPFNVEFGPLFRAQIIKLNHQEHLAILTAHHIICDGWSWAVMITDLGTLYSAFKQQITPDLDEPERFSEYAIALAEAEGDEEATETLNYWLQEFAQSVPVLDFPTDRPRPPLRTFNSDRKDWDLAPELVSQLKQLGTSLGCSFMTTILAGFEVFLHRLTGQEDVIVGVPAAGQAASGRYNMVGHCVNLLPLRTQVQPHQTFTQYLKARKSSVLDAYDHQQFTFGHLVQKLVIKRDPSRIPLVPIVFNIDQGLEAEKLPFDGLEVELFSNPRSYENFELFINATELKGKVTLECQYNTNLFDADTIQRRMGEFQNLLEAIVANPDQLVAKLPLLPQSEEQLLAQWNNTQTPYPQEQCIHELFEAQVDKTPDKIAVIFEDQQLTYYELDQKANQLAHYLQSLGVGTEVVVGVCCDRGLDMVIGVLGILKAGGAYIPIDPAYPQERIAFMAEDSQIAVLLTQSHLTAQLPSSQANLICLDRDWHIISAASDGTRLSTSGATTENLAYIIYTSGSTGKPKGVQIEHRSVVNFLTSMSQKPGITEKDVLLAITTISFDIAGLEIYLPLSIGAKILLVSRETAADADQLMQKLNSYNVTIMQATPATWQMLVAAGWVGNKQLKILCGGEALSPKLASDLIHRCGSLWNMYGPTETTIWSAAYQIVADNQPITIGYPIANTQIHVLDTNLQPVPIGVPGELHIGGVGLARGYLNRLELTIEKFIPNPFSSDPNARLYKTGDLARWLPNGQVECLGRIDSQVKVRGFRIELGEIEANLVQHPAVKEAVAIVREDIPGEKVLVSYFVPVSGKAEDNYDLIAELRQFLKEQLPSFMVPTTFMVLDAMPLTPNGKVDRKALPKPDMAQQLTASYVPPSTDLERQIADIWSQVLNLQHVGIHDNFFELGGYSLLATQVVSRLRKTLQVEILLPHLFEVPTIAELARRIEALRWVAQGANFTQNTASNDYEEGEL
ncbi:non-ribosomal peptide synthetase [Aetokthonos hydrillicola Thurmond2011]|jgi:amino acid adenylation domain-containing protein|uniref:Non-ribosomal peptide synthetase n=1 Tax=Aetokthonos hydrillicola Thurmond2011 TaxID=2712845 RepID=A0AAP5I104_9CYAN|nr:non-ribosomal peptide synthetase [Aetokthonos hydrillicola]MBO3462590.1 amino acid adenylation domain-containing protein [Aetokthonos hydrillicola CCALA 1050]MBW4589582.1 amino acid adenylation domain-containing protein [Aetokthonos hydrillicola CCALA 1050]MDR9893182.1 non-ribosomal peptide synthetase [Aetokthonos hydrillicola Thurmond2011]